MKKVNWFRHTSFISSIHHSISFNSTPWIDWNENEWSHSLRRPFELVSLAAVAPLHSLCFRHLISSFAAFNQSSFHADNRCLRSLRGAPTSRCGCLAGCVHFHQVHWISLHFTNFISIQLIEWSVKWNWMNSTHSLRYITPFSLPFFFKFMAAHCFGTSFAYTHWLSSCFAVMNAVHSCSLVRFVILIPHSLINSRS